jgi:hypothetical protein
MEWTVSFGSSPARDVLEDRALVQPTLGEVFGHCSSDLGVEELDRLPAALGLDQVEDKQPSILVPFPLTLVPYREAGGRDVNP